MKPLRLLLVDRSALRRGELRQTLEASADIRVVGELADPRDALAAVTNLRPSLIALDTGLLEDGGLGAIELIMAERPTPILLLASGPMAAEEESVHRALRRGALHVESLPAGAAHSANGELARLVPLIHRLAAVHVVRHMRPRTGDLLGGAAGSSPTTSTAAPSASAPVGGIDPHAQVARQPAWAGRRIEIIGLGASIGGPNVLAEILAQLPRPLPVSVAVVQHLPADYAQPFAEYLKGRTGLPVHLVTDSVPLRAGVVFVPTDDRHLVIVGPGRIGVSAEPPVSGHRPAVDQLFLSLARHYGAAAVGILLTGLGSDGSQGLLELRRRDALTIAQDAVTATVDGMPRAARELGAAHWVLSPAATVQALRRLLGDERGGHGGE